MTLLKGISFSGFIIEPPTVTAQLSEKFENIQVLFIFLECYWSTNIYVSFGNSEDYEFDPSTTNKWVIQNENSSVMKFRVQENMVGHNQMIIWVRFSWSTA